MNFYTIVKYFWVLVFVAVVFNIVKDANDYWQIGISLLMILIFSVADGLMNDRKILVKK
ncbi:hypothetical protein SEA_MAKAI_81 [Arthrobacter phage Makai]|nr:hypothetical protein SEA_MAKAI_81 [Arthrobacter phage Makai]